MTSDPLARFVRLRSARLNRFQRLRPMLGSEIVDVAMRVFQAMGASLLRISAGPCLFCLAVSAFVFNYALPYLGYTSNPRSMATQIGEAALGFSLSLFVGGPLFVIGVCTAAAGVTSLVSDYMVGNVPNERAAHLATMRALPKLVGLAFRDIFSLSIGFIVSMGLLILSAFVSSRPDASETSGLIFGIAVASFVPATAIFVYVASVRGLGPAVAVLEGVGAKEASRRSRYLLTSKDRSGAGSGTMFSLLFAGAFILVALLTGIYVGADLLNIRELWVSIVGHLPMTELWVMLFDLTPLFLSIWVIVPFLATTTTVLYYDRRIRLEGYDIETLAGDVWRADKASRFQL